MIVIVLLAVRRWKCVVCTHRVSITRQSMSVYLLCRPTSVNGSYSSSVICSAQLLSSSSCHHLTLCLYRYTYDECYSSFVMYKPGGMLCLHESLVANIIIKR